MAEGMAFEDIVRDTESVVRAYIAGLGVSTDTVDDLAQEVYLAFYKGMDSLPPSVVPVRWLKGIAYNVCMNHFRRSKRLEERRLEYLAETMSAVESQADAALHAGMGNERLKACLQKMNERQRLCIRLRYEECLSAEKVAERIGTNAGAIRVTIFRLIRMLRACVTETASEAIS